VGLSPDFVQILFILFSFKKLHLAILLRQIPGLPDFSSYNKREKYTCRPQNVQNSHKIVGRKIDQMVIKYTNIFHCKTFQNLPKLGFLV
jgi:hypothetical protein